MLNNGTSGVMSCGTGMVIHASCMEGAGAAGRGHWAAGEIAGAAGVGGGG